MIDGRISLKRKLTLGADPEIFVFKGPRLIPAFEFLPPKGEDRMMYWDGFQAEWKYDHDDNYCQNNLVLHTRAALQNLTHKAKAYNKDARLSLKNVVRIPQATLNDAHPRHVELGCMPSFNAYGMKGKEVYNPRELKHRFAGGHMHFGTWGVKPNYERIIKTLDSILGVWSVGVARNIDDPIRRQYYGLAGEYRKPRYANGLGVEYRVLSNWWLASPGVMQLTWDIGRLCVRLAASLKLKNLWISEEAETVDTINACDYQQAAKIIKRNEPMFRWMLNHIYSRYYYPKAIDRAVTISQQGLESVVNNPDDFKKNWHFDDYWVADAGQPWARWTTSCG